MKNYIVGSIAVIALIFSLVAIAKDSKVVNTVREIAVGGSAGPTHYNRQNFQAGYQSGGTTMATTTTAATYTLLQDEFDQDVSYIEWNTGINTTLTTMASTSMDFLGNTAGDKRVYDFYSATSTTAATITFSAGTGVDLQSSEAGSLIINGLEHGRLTFIRKSDSDVIVLVEPSATD